jgi:CheY-like chemotaxis protein
VRSEVGVGSEFFFVVPLPGAEGAARTTGEVAAPAGGQGRVLVVDDDPQLREWLVRLLQRDGLRVEQAENGKQALHLFPDFAPHVVLTDLRMPVMDGMETAARLRTMKGGTVVAILAFSADADARQAAQGAADGLFDKVLAKPIDADQLLRTVREYLISAGAPAAQALAAPKPLA